MFVADYFINGEKLGTRYIVTHPFNSIVFGNNKGQTDSLKDESQMHYAE